MADQVLERLARVEGRVEEHSRITEDISRRFDRVETRLDRVETRLDHIDEKIDRAREDLDGKIGRLDDKFTSYFTWMIGVSVASWLSLMYQVSRAAK